MQDLRHAAVQTQTNSRLAHRLYERNATLTQIVGIAAKQPVFIKERVDIIRKRRQDAEYRKQQAQIAEKLLKERQVKLVDDLKYGNLIQEVNALAEKWADPNFKPYSTAP